LPFIYQSVPAIAPRKGSTIRSHSLNTYESTYYWSENEKAKANQGRLPIVECQRLHTEGSVNIHYLSLNAHRFAYRWSDDEGLKANHCRLSIRAYQRLRPERVVLFAVTHWIPMESRINEPKMKDQRQIISVFLSKSAGDCVPKDRRLFAVSHWLLVEFRITDPRTKD